MTESAVSHGIPLIFPVGHFMGAFHPGAGAPARHHSVRIGHLEISFSEEPALSVWIAAHQPADEPRRPWTRAEMIATARDELSVTDPLSFLDEFLELGVLVEVDPSSSDAVGFAREHRLLPLMVGLGNTAENPLFCGAGLPGMSPLATMSSLAYDIFGWSAVSTSLWQVCQAVARAGAEAGVRDPGQRVPETVLSTFLPELQTLVGLGAVCLDESKN